MPTINLLEETELNFEHYQKTWDDVAWIGCQDFTISISNYKTIAAKTNYNCGYGAEEVATDLVIVFKDNTWLSRESYDGSEWFRYNICPQKSSSRKVVTRFMLPLEGDRGLYAMNFPL